ncbi:RNI-like protein, partial [Testicularia cyperi]
MSNTVASSPRGSNSPSPSLPDNQYSTRPTPAVADAGPSSRRMLVDAEMEDRSASPADFASTSRMSAPRPPPSPSSTSQSDDGGGQDFADLASVEEIESRNGKSGNRSELDSIHDLSTARLSRRGTLIPASPTSSNGTWILQNNTASNLPHEILLHIFKYVVLFPPNLLACLQVCKSWCLCGVELLWHRPTLYKISSLFKLIAVIRKPDQLFPYASFVRRLNFSVLANQLEDQLFLMMAACTRLERLTLAGCSHISDSTLVKVFQETKQLVAIDLTDLGNLTDETLLTLAANGPRIQGINLSGCKKITSKGVVELAKSCRLLRRVKLCGCENIDDEALIALTQHCPALLEVDLINCPKVSDLSVREIWTKSFQMRELRLAQCGELTDNAFPSARGTTGVTMLGTAQTSTSRSAFGSAFASDSAPTSRGTSPGPNQGLEGIGDGSLTRTMTAPIMSMPLEAPQSRLFDHLRILDLTNCNSISDDTVEGIVANVPRLKNLLLTKCTRLTDESLYSISKLGKNLHYLHLGHVSNITDRAVTHLARSCTRLRYIDVACCPNLTDLSVTEIAHNMPKLRRIGLVKVINLTDQAIYGLVDRYTSLERIHLSYCENVSVPAIFCVLQRLTRLTHLSLTGVPAFRRPELQVMCRPPPKDFNDHQRQAFCVYSGKGVNDLRKYLQGVYADEQLAAHFGQLEPRVRDAFAGLTTDAAGGPGMPPRGPQFVPHPQTQAHMGAGNVAPHRLQLSAADQMYFEQQRQIQRLTNARRAAEDARRLINSTGPEAQNRQ